MRAVVQVVRAGAVLACLAAVAQAGPPAHPAAMDRDLLEVTVPQLQRYYAEHRYTIAQVVDWHLERIHRYNGIYRAVEQVFAEEARAVAAREDADLFLKNFGPAAYRSSADYERVMGTPLGAPMIGAEVTTRSSGGRSGGWLLRQWTTFWTRDLRPTVHRR